MLWTIYNHGTGSSSLKDPSQGGKGGEIVNLFGNNDRNPPFRGKIVTEGAGSIGDPNDLVLQFTRLNSGQYAFRQDQGKSRGTTRTVKQATGGGVQENVDNTLEFIRALNLAGQCPTQINMIGWSRGAVTCIRLAYRLSKSQDPVLRSIPINIFAVDPVAGFGHNTEVDAVTVNDNVRNYFATMAAGEERRFFKPIAGQRLNITNPGATSSWILPVPGNHSDTAYNHNPVGKIVFNLAYRFLDAVRSSVEPMQHYKLSDLKTWELYESLLTGTGKVHGTGLMSKLTMGGKAYKRTAEAGANAAGNSSFFPNYHAELVFKQAYPVCYRTYFGAGEIMRRNTQNWAMQHSAAIVAEQNANGMSQALRFRLDGLAPGVQGAPAPANVVGMATGLGLVG